MIDIFLKSISKDKYEVYFVQLGCTYTCLKSKYKQLISNVISLSIDYKKTKNIEDEFLPLNVCHYLYSSKTEFLYKDTYKKTSYEVRKIF